MMPGKPKKGQNAPLFWGQGCIAGCILIESPDSLLEPPDRVLIPVMTIDPIASVLRYQK